MDAELKFYKQNRLLLRFLIISTIVFLGLVTIIWWQGRDNIQPTVKLEKTKIQHFSDRATVSEVTYAYSSKAKYITDIESYPEIKRLFFSEPIITYNDEDSLKLALEEVNRATLLATAYGNDQVFNASYYIGNLWVLPNLALHDLLLSKSRPYTTELIETALADVRAGTVTIQNYFDEATPIFYNASLTPAVYFPTPSFPSLTVTEAMTVFYVLSEIDPVHARFYEQQARNYTAYVFASGSHFKVDIEYALKLANAYDSIRQTIPAYQALLNAAKEEWTETPKVSSVPDIYPTFNFKTEGFSYQTNREFITTENWGYKPPYPDEELTGSLRFSLVDERLSPAVAKLYEFNLSNNDLLPLAIDLRTKKFPLVKSSVAMAHYFDGNTYSFITGTVNDNVSLVKGISDIRLLKRDHEVVSDLGLKLPPQEAVTGLVFSSSGNEAMFTKRELASSTKIINSSIERFVPPSKERPAFVDSWLGESVSYLDLNTAVFVKGNEVMVHGFKDGKDLTVTGISKITSPTTKRQARFFIDQGILIVYDTEISDETLTPSTQIYFYLIKKLESGEYQATKKYKTVLTDAEVTGVELSPAGRYLAITSTTGLNRANSALLIFDTINGIIKREIDLKAFAAESLWFDQWVVPNPS